ncbi:hypothetical protein BBG47_26890 [Paenibacillus sp. KS1]|uniref:contractile injection system protein, VgrG/Pvc8 family n=1 Tax=Paenibacillus sp. KS1 TaxID=1849249 RepID=UPI00080648EF|nr:contractile injection system protein, VgrG/Pvc8 family [Paenibacillus sp. KS1]OBY76477.1 hypothetical protein BBG47_26890 [Paenibacillus sp. KS1]
MQDKVMTFGDIYVAPFEFTNLQSLKVVKQFNEHVHLKITGIIPEEKKDSYAELSDGHGQMRVSLNNESGEPKYWFRGVVTQVSLKSVRGIYYLTAHAVSHSYLLDIEKKKRSFQNPNMSYAGLVRSVLSDYAGSDFIHCASEDEVLDTLAMQYEETDWQFLKRMASPFFVM